MLDKYSMIYTVIILLSITTLGMAQNHEVTGTVTDANTGESLPGVNILIQGTAQGTTTDLDGEYQINVEPDGALVFSYVGYETVEIPVEGRDVVNVQLSQSAIMAEELVVVGYGEQEKVNLTGSVGTVSSREIENRPVASVEEALQGAVPGLNIVRTSGKPGAQSISLKIRGTSTFTSNPTLVVIDGVPTDRNRLDRLNPQDIESISVLKDAATAALYGSRAAGGVILVTTKTGVKGAPQLRYNSTVSVQRPTRFPDKVSALNHALLSNEARENDGNAPKFSEEDINRYSSSEWQDVDWDEFMLRDALQNNQSISLSGGAESYDYYLSLGYLKQEGIIPNTEYERFNIQLNQNIRVNEQFKIGFKGNYSPTTRIDAANGYNMLGQVSATPPIDEIKTDDGRWLNRLVGGSGNPIARGSKDGGQRIVKSNYVSGKLTADYEIFRNLMFSGSYGLVREQARRRDFLNILTLYDQVDHDKIADQTDMNELSVNNSSSTLQNVSLLMNYTNNFGDHQIDFLGGFTSEWFEQMNDYVSVEDFLTDDIYTISAGSRDKSLWNIAGGASDWALASFISRLNYTFKDKYILEAAMRYDGSSRFVDDLRWGFFPTASAGWILSNENFLDDNEILTFLKVRASWGQVGNQNVGFYPFANTLSQRAYYFNGQPQRAVSTSGAPNPLLTWETKESMNFGLEGSIYDNLLEFEVDLFKEKTSDILLQLPLPRTFGQPEPVQNAGRVDNKGWEVQLSHRNTYSDFSYGISFQVSDATNEVIDMGGVSPRISGNTITEEGRPINEWYGLEVKGSMQEKNAKSFFQSEQELENHAFQNPGTSVGDLKYIDQNGDGQINSEDRVRLGRSDPRFPFGVRLNLNYKNFDFTAFGQGVLKHKVWSNSFTAQNFDRENSTLRTYHLDRWTPDNPNAKFPKTRMGTGACDCGINDQFSSFWLEDASYFRLKHVELGYNIPYQILRKVNFESARIFVSGENLITITNYLGYDPELATGTGSRLVEGRYPLSKVFNFGINLNF